MPRLRLRHAATLAAATVAASAIAIAAASALPAAAAPRSASHTGAKAAQYHRVPQHTRDHGPEFYLSLGDSLSVGDQPNAQGVTLPTSQGYPDQLQDKLRRSDPDLRLAKLGCPGETTATLNNGGICGYRGDHRYSLTAGKGTQLAAALAFLREHRGHVPLITIDVGANDLNSCISLGSISAVAACAGRRSRPPPRTSRRRWPSCTRRTRTRRSRA